MVQVVQLLPLGGSSLALVASLLTVVVGSASAPEPEDGVPSDAATALVLLVTASVLPTQAVAGGQSRCPRHGSAHVPSGKSPPVRQSTPGAQSNVLRHAAPMMV